jgi:protein-S-isoprenylcysteine O-methyltransferase Ste14
MNYSKNSMLPETAEPQSKTRKDSPQLLVFPPLMYLGTLLTALAIHFFWPAHLGLPIWARSGAALFIVSGVALAAWGRVTMMRAGTNVVPTKPTLAIVTGGPFRFTRNPLYLGGLGLYLGLTLALNSLWLLLLAAPMLVVLRWGIIAPEERYLEAKFGTVYLAYKARVRRWL